MPRKLKELAPAAAEKPAYTTIQQEHSRWWEVRDSNDELVCLTVYRKGAREVVRQLAAYGGAAPHMHLQNRAGAWCAAVTHVTDVSAGKLAQESLFAAPSAPHRSLFRRAPNDARVSGAGPSRNPLPHPENMPGPASTAADC